ncbi:MAG: hypothetical protein R3F11_13345 [Verrucomicrobiales bacterium]
MKARLTCQRRARRGYTIVEALIAASVLTAGVAAASALSLAMSAQEEMSHRVARCLNHHETYGRLFQLGLSPTEAAALLPPEPTADSVTPVVTVQNYTVDTSAQISVTRMDSTMTFSTTPNAVWSAGTWTSGASNGATTRTHKITVIRPIVP